METWTEVAKHLREADYNAGATLGAFLLGFVIQFTLRKGGTQSTTQNLHLATESFSYCVLLLVI